MVQSINGPNVQAALVMADLRTTGVEAARNNAEQMRSDQARDHVQVESAQYLLQAYEASRPAKALTFPSGGETFASPNLARSSHDLVIVPDRPEPPSYDIRAGADGVAGEEGLVRDALDRLAAETRSGNSFLDGLRAEDRSMTDVMQALRADSDERTMQERLQDLRDQHHGSSHENGEAQEISLRRRMAMSRG